MTAPIVETARLAPNPVLGCWVATFLFFLEDEVHDFMYNAGPLTLTEQQAYGILVRTGALKDIYSELLKELRLDRRLPQ